MAVAVDPNHAFKPFSKPPRCKLPSYSQLDYSMLEPSSQTIKQHHACGELKSSLHRSLSTPCLSINSRLDNNNNNNNRNFESNSRIEIIGGHRAPRARALVVEVGIAMASGALPEPVSTGLGGAYFLKSQNGDIVAVAKPMDEEPLALNNPKGFAGRLLGQPGMKRSIMVGETGIRELAAYLLDHGGFAGVPPTALVKMFTTKFHVHSPQSSFSGIIPCKIVSLQRFVDHVSDAGDLGPSGFSVASIHRIGIVDVRLLNLDRHAGNLLVKKGQGQGSHTIETAELVPIDHGFCLPESLDDPYFEWLHWPQASIPFSEAEIDYISSLDPFKDAEMLRIELPSLKESAIRVFVLCNIFLKQGVKSGMCLSDIGQMMTRDFNGGEEENWSMLENLCLVAMEGVSIRAYDDISSSNNQVDEEEDIDEDDVFQFDYDTDIDQNSLTSGNHQRLKPSRFLSEKSMNKLCDSEFLDDDEIHCEEDSTDIIKYNNNSDKENDNNSARNSKVMNLMRSKSFAVPNHSNDSAGISFGELTRDEWESFLERFQQVLSEFFEAKKGLCMSKERLGNSCEF